MNPAGKIQPFTRLIKSGNINILLILLLFFPSVTAVLNAGNVSGQIDLNSSYIWRGWDLNPVHKPVLQPSMTYAFGNSGFAVNAWFSVSSEDWERNETNITLSYDFQVSENIAVSAGITHYGFYFTKGFTFDDNTTHEVYLSASLPKIPFSPGLTVYYDFHNGDGVYILGTVRHSVKLGPRITADLSTSLGYNGGLWLDDSVDADFSDLVFGIALPFRVGSVSLTPSANYSVALMDEISEENHFWAGLAVAF